jgi:ABC-type nitrate/sulfonate/bicarbonate transport system substrate-binding protein
MCAPLAEAAPTVITIALPSANLGALAALATSDKAGLFAANGIEPSFKVMEGGPIAIAALIAGSVQFAVAGPSEVVNAQSRGIHLVFIANLYRGLSGSLVLSKTALARVGVRADAPVRERIHALDGLLVAVPSPASSLLTPIKAAAEATGAKVRFTYMAQDAMGAALRAGSIDAMVASSPIWMTAVESGTGVLWIDGPKGELPADLLPLISGALATTADYARQHPDIVGQVIATLNALAALVHDDPARAQAAFAAAYPQLRPDTAAAAFGGESANFSQPTLTVGDLRHEMANLPGTGAATPVDPASILYSK